MALTQSRVLLQQVLEEKQKQYEGDNSILGISSLTFPAYIDSSRTIMDVNHQLQRVVVENTEFPYVFTNSENMFGHRSTYNVIAKSDLEVWKIIPKFDKLKIDSKTQPALIIFYNRERDEYDLIYKQDVQNLPEKYGFQYDHHVLDNLKEGDVLEKGTTLTRPTSYDKFDNYGFGQNVNFMYRLDMYTIEDAIVVSDRFAKSFVSTEVELVKVTLNENNFLGNAYGDEEVYKCFPDIGEDIKDNRLCIWKMLNNSQVLFDMKSANMQQSMPSDVNFYNSGTIVDIDIYCNKHRDQIPNTKYNQQVLRYIDMDISFYQRVLEATQELIDSGYNVSKAVKEWNKRAKELLDKSDDTGYKIKDENNSVFSNIVIYFLVKRKVGLSRGQKLVGRYGNKGVISQIRPTREMPHFGNGEVVDVIFDSLGVPNRLNIFQLYEQSVTAQARQVREHLKTLKTVKEKEDVFFKFLRIYNEDQADRVYQDYIEENKTDTQKMVYFKEYIEEYGIYVHIESFWHKKLMWDCVNEAYDTFDFLKPYRIYFWQKDTQRWVRQIKDEYVGYMHVMKMKQSSKKGLSVRSTGPINNYGLPDKSDDAKKFIIRHSNTPVRFGRQETENNLMFMDPEYIVKEFLFQRNSPVARMALGSALQENYAGVYDLPVTGLMTNKNVEMLEVHLLQMGYELSEEYDILDLTPEPGVKTHIYNGRKYICTSDEMRQVIAHDLAKIRVDSLESGEIYLGTDGNFEEFVDKIAGELKDQIEMYMS
jgi:DNA-directed RNA polymerase beta subunit